MKIPDSNLPHVRADKTDISKRPGWPVTDPWMKFKGSLPYLIEVLGAEQMKSAIDEHVELELEKEKGYDNTY